ncbi:MAG: acyl-CoA dehydrogenase family protein [Brevundimonas sp.]
MGDRTFLDWPFFDDRHRAFAAEIDGWCEANGDAMHRHGDHDLDGDCRAILKALAEGGWLRNAVPDADGKLDVRTLCLTRETLARRSGLADFVFAMQGLGSGPISLFGTAEQKARWLPGVASGDTIAAFALSEPEAGSDVAAMAMTARRDGDSWVLDGVKTFISNGGLADRYAVFARTGDGGAKGISAFVVDAETPGFEVVERIPLMAAHPLATIRFNACRIDADRILGEPGQGFRIAMGTLDVFRSTVAAAALGFSRRAFDEAAGRAVSRRLFGAPMSDLQLVQASLADMALRIDASALLIYRAAWLKDQGAPRVTREAAMAKLYATDEAQVVIDQAVQLFGGLGVTAGHPVERLYREIRALRIYEGASEVQKIVIARQALAAMEAGG